MKGESKFKSDGTPIEVRINILEQKLAAEKAKKNGS